MPNTKTFTTDAFRRVPYKDSIYRNFQPNGPAMGYTKTAPTLNDPAKQMARAKRIPEVKNPSPVPEGGVSMSPKEMMRRMTDEQGI